MKPLVVQKYGGTSVGTIERIQEVARRAHATAEQGNRVIVVVSAMSGETNRLLELTGNLSPEPNARESDVVVASGEQVSAALLAIALQQRGIDARSFLGHQICIHTDEHHGRAALVEDYVHAANALMQALTPRDQHQAGMATWNSCRGFFGSRSGPHRGASR